MNSFDDALVPHRLDALVEQLDLDLQPRLSSNAVDVLTNLVPGVVVHRNKTLTSLAGSMRAQGMTHDAINAALQAENVTRFGEPLDASEVERIARSVARYPPRSGDSNLLRSLNDKGNAERFVAQHAEDIRYVAERGRWIIWNDTCWVDDATGEIIERAKVTAGLLFSEVAGLASDDLRKAAFKHAQASNQRPRLEAMEKLARSDRAVVVRERDLDRDDWVLGLRNGVLDLRAGTLRPHRREDLITRIAPVEFDAAAACPIWDAFIDRVTGGNNDLARYLARVVGYCLTGSTQEQVLFFLYGSGANGKSTFLNVLRRLLGDDLAKQTSYETLAFKKHGRGSTNDLARLQGVRAVLTTEIEDGSQLDESLVKQLTGGEAITARFLYREFTEYDPKFKLLIAGNHKPVIRGDDDGIWRRVHLVPFTTTIPEGERDPCLLEKLLTELPGVLNC